MKKLKKSKSLIIISIVLIVIALSGYKAFSNYNIPATVESLTVVNTNDDSRIEINESDSKKIAELANGARNYFAIPACIGSNIELEFHTKTKTVCRQICGDDCGTLWDEKGNSYSISDSDMKGIKDILSNYGIEIIPQ